jgi:hypothetical protein
MNDNMCSAQALIRPAASGPAFTITCHLVLMSAASAVEASAANNIGQPCQRGGDILFERACSDALAARLRWPRTHVPRVEPWTIRRMDQPVRVSRRLADHGGLCGSEASSKTRSPGVEYQRNSENVADLELGFLHRTTRPHLSYRSPEGDSMRFRCAAVA